MTGSDPLDRFDHATDALGHRYRRRLLVALLDHNPQDDDDAQEAERALGAGAATTDDTRVRIELTHTHLPKLEELGYITWDRERGEIHKGPNWEEIEPMIQLLDENRNHLPAGWH